MRKSKKKTVKNKGPNKNSKGPKKNGQKKYIKRVGIVSKGVRPEVIEITKQVLKVLDKKVDVFIIKNLAKKLKYKKKLDLKHPNVELIITVGGDGTILYTEKLISGKKIPILGVKCGRMGFLAEIDKNIEEDLKRLLRGEFFIEEHTKLDVRLNGKDIGDALNDVVVITAEPGKIQRFSIDIHGDRIKEIVADGIVVATPTGSTAYGMSAGGPIIDPILDAYEIVPICPYKLGSRPMVVPSDTLTEIKVTSGKDCMLVLDGLTQHKITRKDEVEITKSYNKAYFIKFQRDFFRKMRRKLA